MPEPLSTTPPPDSDHCRVCRTALRPTQRYCTACGERREGVRLPFLDALAEQPTAAVPAVAAAPAAPGEKPPRGFPVGPIGVVLGALAIGLVAGRWAADTDPVAPPTQEIRVVGGVLPAAGTGATGAGAVPAPAATTATQAEDAKPSTKTKTSADDRAPGVPKKLSKQAIDGVLDDASGNQNLAPKDLDPTGANFDEIK